jgi:hypothetical protein
MRWGLVAMALGWLLAAAPVGAQTAFRCGSAGRVTYSEVPCSGGRALGTKAPHRTDRWTPPPQDRATIARRAPLPAQTRQECRALDTTLHEQQAALKARGEGVTLQEEMPFVRSQQRYRELKC